MKAQLVVPATERATQDANLVNARSLTHFIAVCNVSVSQDGACPAGEERKAEANRAEVGEHTSVRGDSSTFSGVQIVVALLCATKRRAPSFPIAHLIHQMRREILPRDPSCHLTGDVGPPT